MQTLLYSARLRNQALGECPSRDEVRAARAAYRKVRQFTTMSYDQGGLSDHVAIETLQECNAMDAMYSGMLRQTAPSMSIPQIDPDAFIGEGEALGILEVIELAYQLSDTDNEWYARDCAKRLARAGYLTT